MKKAIILCIVLVICFVPIFSFAADGKAHSEIGMNEIKINEKLDELITKVENKEVKEKLIKYFYLPAYSKVTICNSTCEAEAMVEKMKENSDDNYRLALHLISLDRATFDKEIKKLICDGADKISKMNGITVEKGYLDYIRPYVDNDIIKSIEEKYGTNDMTVVDAIVDNTETKATTQKSKVFMKEYGSSTTVAYTMFKVKVTWSYNTSEITSLKTSGQQIVTPSYIQTFSAKTKTTHNGAYGYVQRGWGYTNAFYGTGQVVGYYIIDVKLKKGTVLKENLATISTSMWSSYSWG